MEQQTIADPEDLAKETLHGEDIKAVMVKADEAMYASKAAGKNRLSVCTTDAESGS